MIQKIINVSIALTLALLIFSCQKIAENKVVPVLILEGNNPMNLILGCEWVEPGVLVKDDKQGTRLFTTGLPLIDTTGVYYVDYLAVDSDSNQISDRRTVYVGPLTIDDVVGDYRVEDTTGLGENIKKYESKISVFPNSTLLLQINNLNDRLMAFFTFDSTGFVGVDYTPNDTTLITGSGNFGCEKTHFKLEYYIKPPHEGEHHKATFTKIN